MIGKDEKEGCAKEVKIQREIINVVREKEAIKVTLISFAKKRKVLSSKYMPHTHIRQHTRTSSHLFYSIYIASCNTSIYYYPIFYMLFFQIYYFTTLSTF